MQILGSVDRCDESFIDGWVTVIGQPEVKLGLELRLGQEVVGRCVADVFRQDLKDGGVGANILIRICLIYFLKKWRSRFLITILILTDFPMEL